MSLSRRDLIYGACGAAVLLGVGGAARLAWAATPQLRPPGGQDEAHLTSACIRCDRCRSVCPTKVIQVSGIEDGLGSARTPKMHFRPHSHTTAYQSQAVREGYMVQDPSNALNTLLAASGTGYCNFCMLCVASCPTGALASFDAQRQWIGEAVIDEQICIAFVRIGGCRKCVDYCPSGAIELDSAQRPVVDPAKCNGCGVCENICPSDTHNVGNQLLRGINVQVNPTGRPQ